MRAAFLHLDLSMGPVWRNLALLARTVEIAAKCGAKWIVAPETAVQGYYFHRLRPGARPDDVADATLADLRALVRRYELTLFLGCGVFEAAQDCAYNCCLVYAPDGALAGVHRKLRSYGSAEDWAAPGQALEAIDCGGVKVGALVCADIWDSAHAVALKEKGASLLVDIAAWPPTACCGDPRPAWERSAKAADLPLWVCNQTGRTPWMDMTIGASVVIEGGRTRLSYKGDPAVLLFDWDASEQKLLSGAYDVIRIC